MELKQVVDEKPSIINQDKQQNSSFASIADERVNAEPQAPAYPETHKNKEKMPRKNTFQKVKSAELSDILGDPKAPNSPSRSSIKKRAMAPSRFGQDPMRRLMALQNMQKRRKSMALPSNFNAKIVWRRTRNRLMAIHRLNAIAREIQLYGSPAFAKDEVQYYRLVRSVKGDAISKMDQKKTKEKMMQSCCIIYPDSKFKFVWTMVMLTIMLYTIIIQPIRLAFLPVERVDAWFVIQIIVDIIQMIDIFVSCSSAYNDNENELVVSRKTIASQYLKRSFSIDFIACFPFSLILTCGGYYNYSKVAIALDKGQKIIRLYEILKMIGLVKVARGETNFGLIDVIINKLQLNVSIFIS